jgi:ribosomal protein S18 acetylase RimI-like enzyme
MHIQRDLTGIQEQGLAGFFVGWPDPPSAATLLRILRGSSHVALALDGGRVVGFINAVSDGVLAAYIPLLEVLPEHQGRGLGRRLVEDMLAQLEGYYMVDVVCDAKLQKFYEGLGLTAAVGMLRRDYKHQPGRQQG